ncbi:S8 family serine peptidase [Streptomyces sp. DSM 41527]|uniref:S8 family serine peptidase n=1 Tax=Streptomyces mooreae TaxID=3075523 RepID=A0ABU2TG57_9ACTN|nr:S8 family serine peptidase [Streptomyces sp. DSM 41527]MDT0459913.1 S8 family serine peptidase [Streptomyces sp. DSM 41527]
MNFTRTLRAVGGAMVVGALLFGTAPVASADQIKHDRWPLRSFEADNVWKVSTGKGVTVAVIDDPVDGSHPDLKGNVLPGRSLLFSERGAGTADSPYEEREHGTAMASLIAGHGHGPGGSAGVKGLAPDAKAMSQGSGGQYEPKGNKVAILSIAGGVVVLLIVIVVVVTVTVKTKRRNGPPPGGTGGYGGPGGPGAPGGFAPQPPGGFVPQPPGGFVPQPPGPYQQQPPGPYQQQPGAPGTYPPGPYQQQPGAPASFPPAPPTPPSGR